LDGKSERSVRRREAFRSFTCNCQMDFGNATSPSGEHIGGSEDHKNGTDPPREHSVTEMGWVIQQQGFSSCRSLEHLLIVGVSLYRYKCTLNVMIPLTRQKFTRIYERGGT
jgi:hypothetical protein